VRRELIDAVSEKFQITQKELIEKDIILHELLTHFSENSYFSKNYLFKGGTCLVKAYLGYVRFSEDLDFTWKNQAVYDGKTPTTINKQVSKESENFGKILEEAASKFGLDFKFEKSNDRYFQFGGGGKMLTLNIWYKSEVQNQEDRIKIQINFLETICYAPENKALSSIAPNDSDLKFLFPNQPYFEKIIFAVYAPREILCEKIRAILTRQGIKARDFLDVYLICKNFKIDLSEIRDNSLKKLHYSIDMYEKYRNNIAEKTMQLRSGTLFEWGEEKHLLLQDVDDADFISFEKNLEKFLKESILKLTDDNFLSEIVTICSNCLKKSYIQNPQKKQFDEIDLSSEKCPYCNKSNTLQAFPM